MKIFKIKFDSKMPTTRKVTVGKDDDFGLAIQIDNQQSQGPTKLLYAGQEVEANKDLIEGYNVFLLKAVKDSTISIKDIDSQVTFTVDISIKKTDVVELGGTGGGGESVWEYDGICTYSIPGVLSVDSCYQTIKSVDSMTFMPANGQARVAVLQNTIALSSQHMCIEAPCDICIKGGQVRIYNDNGNETLNIGVDQWFGNTCRSTTIKGDRITICSNNSLNLATDSGGCNNNAININGCGIYIDAQQGKLQLKSGNDLNICAGNNLILSANYICIDSKCITIKADSKNIIEYCGNYIKFGLNNVDMCIDGGYIGVGSNTFGIHSGRIVLGPSTHNDVDTLSYDLFGNFGQRPNINFPRGTFTFEGVGTDYSKALRTKSLAIVLSAVECALLARSPCDMTLDDSYTTEAFNKLTAIFSA